MKSVTGGYLKHIALIPARGGSTGIENKNLQKLFGQSLVKIAWDQCRNSGIFDQIILSTDSIEIANEIETINYFIESHINSITKISANGYLHKRDPEDAGVYSMISQLSFKISECVNHDFFWIIQPTSPFRSKKEFTDLKKMSELEEDWTSIVSVKDAETIHPIKMFFLNHFLSPVINLNIDDSQPRQLLPKVYMKDGAFYILKTRNLKRRIFLGHKILPYIRKSDFNINIDTPEDLKIARYLYSDFNRIV